MTKTEMTDAEIDALEPGPELDALVAEKVMGWERQSNEWADAQDPPVPLGSPNTFFLAKRWKPERTVVLVWDDIGKCRDWHPSTDANQTLEVASVGFKTAWRSENFIDGSSTVEWGMPRSTTGVDGRFYTAKSLPEAICKAVLLKAVRG